MSDTNPQIETQLNALAELACETLRGEESEMAARAEPLLKSLLMSGYVRKSGKDIRADIEARVKDICREPAMHRGGELSGITQRLQDKFDKLVKWESDQPKDFTDAKAANISSATDA
mgnify:CR=1 FL=1